MKKNYRNFEGIWIPRNIWLSEKLTLQEKAFLVEIKSLDNEDGCFASNEYFSKFFQLSKSRCSEVINKLKKKRLIEVHLAYKDGSKSIERRTIRVNHNHELFNEGVREIEGVIREVEGAIRKNEGGIREVEAPSSENTEDNNKIFNKTINNTTNNKVVSSFSQNKELLSFLTKFYDENIEPISNYTYKCIENMAKESNLFLVYEAMKISVDAQPKKPIRYIQSILENWKKESITNTEQFKPKKYSVSKNQRAESVPDWFYNRNEKNDENIDFVNEREKILAKLKSIE